MPRRSGERMMPSAVAENAYYDTLRPMIRAMTETIESAVARQRLYHNRGKVASVFNAEADRIAAAFAERVVRYTSTAYRASVRKMRGGKPVKTDVLSGKTATRIVNRIVRDNAKLIRSIPRVYLSKVDAAIYSYNEGRLTKHAFAQRMRELADMTLGRARLIAKDQNCKATEALMVARMESDGFYLVKWCHSHLSEKPRDYHLRKWDGHTGKRNGKPNGLNGYIFDIRNPPVIDLKTGERGLPAQLINCKCYLVPVEEEGAR